jgi:signal recognition particle subunit SEC65
MEQADTMKKQWVKVYPSYIDKALKHSEGRKISATLAVENPNIKEIFAICAEELRLDSKMEVV